MEGTDEGRDMSARVRVSAVEGRFLVFSTRGVKRLQDWRIVGRLTPSDRVRHDPALAAVKKRGKRKRERPGGVSGAVGPRSLSEQERVAEFTTGVEGRGLGGDTLDTKEGLGVPLVLSVEEICHCLAMDWIEIDTGADDAPRSASRLDESLQLRRSLLLASAEAVSAAARFETAAQCVEALRPSVPAHTPAAHTQGTVASDPPSAEPNHTKGPLVEQTSAASASVRCGNTTLPPGSAHSMALSLDKLQQSRARHVTLTFPVGHCDGKGGPSRLLRGSEALDWVRKIASSRFSWVKIAAWRDVWDRGYYVSAGDLYGVDFLVYEDHPNRIHAAFAVRVVWPGRPLLAMNLGSLERTVSTVRKTLVLAEPDDADAAEKWVSQAIGHCSVGPGGRKVQGAALTFRYVALSFDSEASATFAV